MKKLVLLVISLLVASIIAGAQTTKVSDKTSIEGTSYITAKASRGATDIKTPYTWSNEKDNISYPIYLHKYTKGDKVGEWTAYVIRVSKKSGKEYKYYLSDGKSIAEDIIRRNPNLIK